MSRRLSSRVRVLLSLAAALMTFAFLVPAAASAGGAEWELRSTWLRYVTRWGGRTTALSPATFSSPVLSLPQAATGAGDVAPFDGGFRSTVLLHGIDLAIEDVSIDFSTGDVTGSGWYTPLLSARRTFSDWTLFTLTGGTRSGTNPKTWTGAVPELTSDGAVVFNGGSNGSYAAGDEFGVLDAEGDF
ncbi:HtaA domain-containing protein [Conexibacter arvalis]|uniref:Htaa domain-containing protein n=1 Tax=Conexibacter arvalis TaxID=912552 RepID=A0A840IMH6_9ACTN|nr:HtaA domain-containing protein [Conexibacter arvalis]MBB4665060.1 hypothetical protein [Conexibacter arvalis]